MRVDIDPAREDSRSPVAVPDQAVVRGTRAVLVDVLSNDLIRWGPCSLCSQAAAANPSQLKVA
ncbi:MAG: hypothetical protein IPM00_16215, partial [Tetrasphaera sp.]|nr:hypothetical protein [Tetrasphaera sp.]